MNKKIIIGTRGSKLALQQADIVQKALRRAVPDCDIEVTVIKTEGDINFSPITLDIIGKGWFTKETTGIISMVTALEVCV